MVIELEKLIRSDNISQEKVYEVENIVVVPFCMTDCLSGKNHGWYECNCNKCYVSSIRDIAQQYDFKTLLVGSKTMLPTAQEFLGKDHKVKRTFAVICPEDIENKTQKFGKENVPKVFENYDLFSINKFCEGEGEQTVVFRDRKPDLNFDEYRQIEEKLKALREKP